MSQTSLKQGKNNSKYKEQLTTLMFEIVGGFCYAVGLYTFARAAQFAPGGVSGLSLVLNHVFPVLPIGTLTLILNIPIVLISYKVIGRRFLLRSLITMGIVAFFTDIVAPFIPVYTGEKILAAIFSGVFVGIGLALIYMRGTSTGGTDFIIMSIKKVRPHLSFGQVILITDCIVILIAGLVFGNVDAVLYGVITTFASSTIIDKMMYRTGSGKLAIIITNDGFETARRISRVADRGATLVKVVGTYSGKERHMLLCVAAKSQIFKVRNIAHEVDPNSFVTITEASEVFGEGFTPHV